MFALVRNRTRPSEYHIVDVGEQRLTAPLTRAEAVRAYFFAHVGVEPQFVADAEGDFETFKPTAAETTAMTPELRAYAEENGGLDMMVSSSAIPFALGPGLTPVELFCLAMLARKFAEGVAMHPTPTSDRLVRAATFVARVAHESATTAASIQAERPDDDPAPDGSTN